MNIIKILNDNQDIVATNYWESQAAELGIFGVSLFKGCLRLLIPSQKLDQIPNLLNACDYAVISTVKDIPKSGFAVEILFETHKALRPALILNVDHPFLPLDRLISQSEDGNGTLSIWIEGPFKVAEVKAFYHRVPSLPWGGIISTDKE